MSPTKKIKLHNGIITFTQLDFEMKTTITRDDFNH